MSYTAVVTGASAGIGEEVCKRMLNEGWHVIGLSRRAPEWTHERFTALSVDLLDPDATQQAADQLAEHDVSHIVHNAGLVWPNLIDDAKAEDVAGLTQLHISAPLTLTKAVLPTMRKRSFGRVVFVTSRAAMGVPTRSAYSATKAGVHGMARTWALELGGDGITVNVVAPGPIKTDNFYGIVEKGSDREANIAAQLPVKRLGTVDDVAYSVMYFADERASFVTGQVLFVCGGGSLGGLSL
jgi:NAD(P)-dependent dehydrogenase (short-subunit alcohol dehydrogenase family)